MQSNNSIIKKKSIFEFLPQYIFVGTGIIYAAGFLVILAFFDRFGIREAGTAFWKTRYIHIGILCLIFPFILNGTILSLAHLIINGKYKQPTMWQRILPIGLLVINLEILCFMLITLTNRIPGGQNIAGLNPLYWILAVTLIGIPFLLLIERLLEMVSPKEHKSDGDMSPITQTFAVIGRWVLTLVVACLDVWYVLDFKSIVAEIQPALALFYIGLSILLGIILSTVSVYVKKQEKEGHRNAITILAFSFIVPLIFLIILSFSYGVFQNIPATRGGGDYSASPKIILTFKNIQTMSTYDQKYFIKDKPNVTMSLILIEETDWAFYLAAPQDGGGPSEWKKIGGRKPEILIVNKLEVAKIHSESRNASENQNNMR